MTGITEIVREKPDMYIEYERNLRRTVHSYRNLYGDRTKIFRFDFRKPGDMKCKFEGEV